RNFLARIVLIVLSLLEYVYFIGIKVRGLAYRLKILNSRQLETKVISVGNITVGGTGKTPVIERLARMLKEQGQRVAVISRGYGADSDHEQEPLIVTDGQQINTGVEQAGDEVYMLAQHLSGVPIVIGGDRYQAGRLVEEEFAPDVILMDDGFQHWQLDRDLDIVVIDAMKPFGYDHLIPRGLLREPMSGLKRADLFVLSKCDHVTPERLKEIKGRLKKYNTRITEARIFTSRHQPLFVKSLTEEQENQMPVDNLEGKRVLALSAIGNPQSFVNGLEDLQARVIDSIIYPDHYKYEEEDLVEIAMEAQLNGVDCVVTTEKDAVKFTSDMLQRFRKLDVGILTLGIELRLENSQGFLEKIF
ncbi:MAG: tetraacyldisaccharide 4'-kinase, partial [Bacillota bacterium]